MVLVTAPILVVSFLRLRKQYVSEQEALSVKEHQKRATSITRHDVSDFVDSLDIATVGAIRYGSDSDCIWLISNENGTTK